MDASTGMKKSMDPSKKIQAVRLFELVGMNFRLVVFYLFESSEFTMANVTFPVNQQSHALDGNYPVDFILLLSSQSHDLLQIHPIKTLRAMP